MIMATTGNATGTLIVPRRAILNSIWVNWYCATTSTPTNTFINAAVSAQPIDTALFGTSGTQFDNVLATLSGGPFSNYANFPDLDFKLEASQRLTMQVHCDLGAGETWAFHFLYDFTLV